MLIDSRSLEEHTGTDVGDIANGTGAAQMRWFWGTVGVVPALAFIGAWFFDRRRAGGFGMNDRERASFDRSRNDPYRHGDNYGSGGGGGFDGAGWG